MQSAKYALIFIGIVISYVLVRKCFRLELNHMVYMVRECSIDVAMEFIGFQVHQY